MIKTIKDVVVYVFVLIWLIGGTIIGITTNLDSNTIIFIFISIMSVLVIFKFSNRKFALWLEKPLKK